MTSEDLDQNSLAARKAEHIELSLEAGSQGHSVFDAYRLPYCALPELNLADVDTTATIFGKSIRQPLVISSMTGGHDEAHTINTNLAIAAEEAGVALGVGSQRVAFKDLSSAETFITARRHAPNIPLLANMGAVQLNFGYDPSHYQRAVEMIEADGLYLHLNALQEAIQPEGDTDFSSLLDKMAEVVKLVEVPVIIKEVGHGIDAGTARRLAEIGVAGIDVAGVGGTSYAWVESRRAHNDDFAGWFKGFGIPSDQAVRGARAALGPEGTVIASGGVRSPVHSLVARALGANLAAAAVPFLRPALEGPDAVLAALRNWEQGLRVALFSSGWATWNDAPTSEEVLVHQS